jgi:putative endonuclease
MNTRQAFGHWGESQAAKFLLALGYKIIGRNVRTPYGEIDLIAEWSTPPTWVFIEVKTRRSALYGMPEDAINTRKQEHFLSAIDYYLQQCPEFCGETRADVIAIQRYHPGEPLVITHFENVLS